MGDTNRSSLHQALEELYGRCNCRVLVRPDPMEFLFDYRDSRDQEVVGLIASSLAYGRVTQILQSVSTVLEVMGSSPGEFLEEVSRKELSSAFRGFKHRWTTGEELEAFLWSVGRCLEKYGGLEGCFMAHYSPKDETVLPALTGFVGELTRDMDGATSLLSSPSKGSACKRLLLYLRWMVRRDAVDLGCWQGVRADQLVMPVDTHIHRLALALGMTRRKQANMATALEITEWFRCIAPHDPLRYDFVLTRLGIRSDMDMDSFVRSCSGRDAAAERRQSEEGGVEMHSQWA